ncbi:helix-turn-helix transcriptional regulator [Niveibacterium sp. SC-1]|uniref:AraC family transcriptional regulator n=1 Tax=Niveibacterium sp. SC-1 TaxID=3135646 RepID=UPI00311D5C38
MTRLTRPVFARAESLPAGSLAPMHSHPWIQLSYALSGVLTVRTARGSFIAPPQRAVWVPAGVAHEVTSSARAEMRSLYIAADALPAGFAAPGQCCVLVVDSLARELVLAASALPADYEEAGPAGRLVGVLLDRLAALPQVAFDLPAPADRRLVQLCEALQAEPAREESLARWGTLLGLSERSLARLFLRDTGLSFAEWRLRLRMLFALGALEEGASVTRVALDSGYGSTSAFIAAFRRCFGTSPGAMFAGR